MVLAARFVSHDERGPDATAMLYVSKAMWSVCAIMYVQIWSVDRHIVYRVIADDFGTDIAPIVTRT